MRKTHQLVWLYLVAAVVPLVAQQGQLCNPKTDKAIVLSPSHQVEHCENGDPRTLHRKNKRFVIPRRFGGGWGQGDTPWLICANVNLHAPLRMSLSWGGNAPRLLTLYVADDVTSHASRTRLRLLLRRVKDDQQVQAKINGVLLGPAPLQPGHWRVFDVEFVAGAREGAITSIYAFPVVFRETWSKRWDSMCATAAEDEAGRGIMGVRCGMRTSPGETG